MGKLRMLNTRLWLLSSLVSLAACSSLKPISFAENKPVPGPVSFFIGRTHSTGVLESARGKPAQRITTNTIGTLSNGVIRIEQDLYPEGASSRHRSFQLKLVDSNHVEGSGSDIAGTARGELYGNYFTWTFRLKLGGKSLVKHVTMMQEMYVMPGGETIIIRSVIRKFGVTVKQITEQFTKDD